MKGFMKATKSTNEQGEAGDGVAAADPPAGAAAAEVVHKKAEERASAYLKNDDDGGDADADEEATASRRPGEETRGQVLQRHKREMQLHKKAVQRSGKKSKDEVACLNKDIEERHARELAEADAREAALEAGDGLAQLGLQQDDATEEAGAKAKKPTKAQKRKEKLAAKEAAYQARLAEESAAAGPSSRQLEEEALVKLLKPRGLRLKEIRADGSCLFRAVEHQLSITGSGNGAINGVSSGSVPSHEELRHLAVRYIRDHRDELLPYLLADADDDGAEDDPAGYFERYCEEMESTSAWGGQVELQALAQALRREIRVYGVRLGMQAMQPDAGGDGSSSCEGAAPLQVCFLEHALGLGAHYNSVEALPLGADDADDGENEEGGSDSGAAGARDIPVPHEGL